MVGMNAGSPSVPPSNASSTTGSGKVTIVPERLIETLMKTLGAGSQDLHALAGSLQNRPNPGRFGGSPHGRQLATMVDGAYDDLLNAIGDAVTGLQNYRTGLGVFRDGMHDADDDVKAKARRQAASVAATPSLTGGSDCLDDSANTICSVTPSGGSDEG